MKKKVRTLVIHPDDRSTDFLKPIYENVPDKTVVTGNISQYELIKLIEEHDRIMMMGHGSPGGLFSIGQFTYCDGYIIDHRLVPLLRQKKNNVFIWCNADEFVKRHKLNGFFSGMFVSEVGEAFYCKVYPNRDKKKDEIQNDVTQSNDAFAQIVGVHINKPIDNMFESVLREYDVLAESNPVARYNHKRLYLMG